MLTGEALYGAVLEAITNDEEQRCAYAWDRLNTYEKTAFGIAATALNGTFLAPLQGEIEMMKETYQHATRVAEDMLEKDRQRIAELEQEKAVLRGEVAKYASMQEYLLAELKRHRSTIHSCAIAEKQIAELEQENQRLRAKIEELEQENIDLETEILETDDDEPLMPSSAGVAMAHALTEQAKKIEALEALVRDYQQFTDFHIPFLKHGLNERDDESHALSTRAQELLNKGA